MCDQTEDHGIKIKSKLDPTSHDRKKSGEKLCLFQDMRSTGEFGVAMRETHNGSIWSEKRGNNGYIGYWLI